MRERFNDAPEIGIKPFEERISKGKKETGRKDLTYWEIFVFAEFRMGLNLTYDSARKAGDVINKIFGESNIVGWRKSSD